MRLAVFLLRAGACRFFVGAACWRGFCVCVRCKDIVKDFGGQAVRDAVITVPAFATMHERRALVTAAEIAGLKVGLEGRGGVLSLVLGISFPSLGFLSQFLFGLKACARSLRGQAS